MARCSLDLRRQDELELTSKENVSYTPLLTEDIDETREEEDPVQFLLDQPSLNEKETMLRKWLESTVPGSEEEEEEEATTRGEEACCIGNIKVTGTCFCKLFVVLYLLACLLVSALYIAIYGPNELYLMPETPPVYKPVKPAVNLPPVHFYDNPYIEWITQKWTYNNDEGSFSQILPDGIDTIKQAIAGTINGQEGVWLLDTNNLYLVLGFGRTSEDAVHFVNISRNLDLNLTNDSYLSLLDNESLFIISSDDIILLNCSRTSIEYCDVTYSWTSPDYGSVSTATYSFSDKLLWIGTSEGLFQLNTSSLQPDDNDTAIIQVNDIEGPVLSVAWRAGLVGQSQWGLDNHAFLLTCTLTHQDVSYNNGHSVHTGRSDGPGFGLLVIATKSKIYFYDGDQLWFEWVSSWYNELGGIIDGPPSSLLFLSSGDLFISNNVSLTRLYGNYTFERIGPQQGLPYNQILSLHYSPLIVTPPPLLRPLFFFNNMSNQSSGLLWIGTQKGYCLYDLTSSRFIGYRYGPRWLPGHMVYSITSLSSGVFVAVTENGLAVVRAEEWTLERKASHYQSMLLRHTRDPGLVSDCPLTYYDSSTCDPTTTDNDGLWTSWAVVSEALRFHVTGNEEARTNAWSLYKGLKFLVDVTGIPGLPARSVLKEGNNTNNLSSNVWHKSVTNPSWYWKGDTSSDEVVGHIFAYSVVYDLVAITLKEKMDVASTLDSIISYIKDNDYTLIDITNHTTTWGVWSPDDINYNKSWADEHGLNSLQILTGLLSAYRMTGKEEYITSWKDLVQNYHYGINMINQKITFPHDINYSDDELAFLPYFVYFFTLKYLGHHGTEFSPIQNNASNLGLLSLKRTWNTVKNEKSSAWISIYSFATGDNRTDLLEDLVWSLRQWPLDLVQWTSVNSHRLDIQFNYEQNSQSLHVLPPNERTQLRWNTNPYQLDREGLSNEMDPCPWLLPYWLSRWIKLL